MKASLLQTQSASARTTLQEFRDLVRALGVSAWPPASVVLLGILSAIIEVFAITLVVTMLFALMARPADSGVIGDMIRSVRAMTGQSWAGLAVAVLILVSLKAGIAQLYMLLIIRKKNDLNARVIAAAHARLVDMPYAELRAQGQGELLNATASDTWQVANADYVLTRMAINACMILIFAGFIFALSWQIALLALVGGAAIALAGQLISRAAREHGILVRRDIEAIYTRLLAAIHGARLVRAFAQEEGEKRRVTGAVEDLRLHTLRAESTRALSGPLNEIGYLVLLIALIGLSASLGVPQAAAFTAIALLYRMAPQIRELEGNRLLFASLFAPLHAVENLLSSPVAPAQAGTSNRVSAATIRFEAVTFQPPGASEPVLGDVTFEIPSGRVTALLGPSGAGKTSVVNLLLRLYEPDEGQIWVGDQRLDRIDRCTWLAGVAAAGQDLDVLEGTIAENLRLGAPNASDVQLRAAAREARALCFIERLPNGFETWVGSFGYNLSGGQRQRLSLARALLRKPQLLILDESTSAVESGVEAEILSAILNARDDLTILLITHRLNRAAHVDHVVRLERGSVVTEGPWTPGLHVYPQLDERRT